MKKFFVIFVLLLCTACSAPKAENSPDETVTTETVIVETADASDGSDYAFMPFVDTNAANLAYIEVVLDGLSAWDGEKFIEPERLSDEDAAVVFELLQQISIDTPPLSGYTWMGAVDGGFGAVFNVYYYIGGYSDYAQKLTVIPYPVHLPDKSLSGSVILNSMCFPIDYELSSQLSARCNELYIKYYPDVAEKWGITANGS